MNYLKVFILLIIATTSAQADLGGKLCVTKQFMKTGLAVKAEPSASSETKMTVGSGRVVIDFGASNGWRMVGVSRSGGVDGYVPEDSVSAKDLDGMLCGS